MKGLRLASVHLAALSERDRRWALSQLSAAERLRLQPHLYDALKLGSEGLRRILDELPEPSRSEASAPEGTLWGIGPEERTALGRKLPQILIAVLAERHRDDWGGEVLQGLDEPARDALSQVSRRLSPAFLERLEVHARRASGSPESPGSASFTHVFRTAKAFQAPAEPGR